MTEEIRKDFLSDIIRRREEIKQQWVKAWLAVHISDEHLNPEWLIKNVRLLERNKWDKTSCTNTVSWELEFIPPK